MSQRERIHLALCLIHIRLKSVRDMIYALAIEVKLNELTTIVNELLKTQDQLKLDEGVFLRGDDPMVKRVQKI